MSVTGIAIAIGTVFCWTLSVQFFEAASKRVGPLAVNIIRMAAALLFFSVFLLIRDGSPLPLDFPPRAWILLGLSGTVGFFIGDIFLFKALVELGPRLAMLLHSLAAPTAAIIGWIFLDENYMFHQWLGIAITLSGVALVILERNTATPHRERIKRNITVAGVASGLLAMFGQAFGMVLSKAGMQHDSGYLDPFSATQIRVIAASICFLLFFTATRRWVNVKSALEDRKAIFHTSAGAFLGPFLGVSLALLALHYLSTGVASTIFSLVPICIIPFSVFLHREEVSLRAIAGACIAVFGVGMLTF